MIALAILEFSISAACLWIFHKSDNTAQNFMFLLFALTSGVYGTMILKGMNWTDLSELFWFEHIVIWVVVAVKSALIAKKELEFEVKHAH